MASSRLIIATLLVIMISASVRAFSTKAPAAFSRLASSQPVMTRFMSTEGGDGGPAIVDICKDKISKLLETENVKVTGMK